VDSFLPLGKIILILVLVLLNGSFTAMGFAIVRVRATQIAPLTTRGNKRALIANHVISHLDSYLSATQLGNTVTSLALGWLGEPFIAQLLQQVFIHVGLVQPALVTAISFAVGFSIITFLNVVLGELAPKSLAIQRSQSVTLLLARPLHLFFIVVRPLIVILNGAATFFLKLAGIQPASESDLAHSEEELRILLSAGKTISSTEKSILLKAMDLRDRTVREVMVPRIDVVFLSTEKTIEENTAIVLENQFTRYPLCEKDLDHVLGMIHLKDLFKLKGAQGDGRKLLDIKREALFVPETTSVEVVLNTFLTKRVLMAIAVDEYGGTAGLVTLENILEELVGEIRDEFDVEPTMVQKVSAHEYLVDGTMPLHDFAAAFGVFPDSRDVVTVSGYVVQLLGRVPERGATVHIGEWVGKIEASEGKKVRTLRLKKSVRPEVPEQPSGGR
jgi:CBS domain containing-hemolysin-like protein